MNNLCHLYLFRIKDEVHALLSPVYGPDSRTVCQYTLVPSVISRYLLGGWTIPYVPAIDLTWLGNTNNYSLCTFLSMYPVICASRDGNITGLSFLYLY